MVTLNGKIKHSQTFLGNLLGNIVDGFTEHVAGIAGHQEHHTTVDQCFDPCLIRHQLIDNTALDRFSHGAHIHYIRALLRKGRFLAQRGKDKLRLRHCLAQIFHILEITIEVTHLAEKHFYLHSVTPPLILSRTLARICFISLSR